MGEKALIYTDGIHIAAESLQELHKAMAEVGIKRCWFHNVKAHPHYDKPKRFPLQKLLDNGIAMVDVRKILIVAETAARSKN